MRLELEFHLFEYRVYAGLPIVVDGGAEPGLSPEPTGEEGALIEPEGKLTTPHSEPNSDPPEVVLDPIHLARITLGDKVVEAEVLSLFDRQAGRMLTELGGASGQSAALLAHTLAGSARAIGAWKVAAVAETVESASRDLAVAALARAIDELAAALREAQARIAKLIGAQ